jgi:prepilin-type N-terminal cleavage/methylation domain-containing protein
MFQTPPKLPKRNLGVSLVETLVVIAVIAILMSLTLVGVQHSRAAARRAQCQSNLHQIDLAMNRFRELRKRIPNAAPAGQVGGWPIELMTFLEEMDLGDQLLANPRLSPGGFSPLLRKRPTLFTCPSGYDGDSELAEVPAAHYILWASGTRKDRRGGRWGGEIGHALPDCRIPWPAGPEYDSDDKERYEAHRDYDPHVPQQ